MTQEHYIADKSSLQQACSKLSKEPWIAVDTEFVREKTYYAQLCLIQLAGESDIYCIDPLVVDDISALHELLNEQPVEKVFHAASQDLEIFFHASGIVPKPVFDTQLAAALLGFGEQLGYAALVKQLLNIELDKSSARTDWTQRPLHNEQIRYALDDVRYLRQLYPMVFKQLQEKKRLEWVQSDLQLLQNPLQYQMNDAEVWRRIKGAGKLKRRQLNNLKHLAGWRERTAEASDKPRRWVIGDGLLLNIAIQSPETLDQLAKTRQMEPKLLDKFGEALLEILQNARQDSPEHWPHVLQSRKPSPEEDATMDLLMAALRIIAAEQEISPGQLCNRSDILRLIRGERDLPILQGWRHRIAGKQVLEILAGQYQLNCHDGYAQLSKKK